MSKNGKGDKKVTGKKATGKLSGKKADGKSAKKAKKTAGKVAQADREVTHKAASVRHLPVVRLAGLLGEVGDQPQLILASVGTIAAGLLGGRRDLVRGGARMLAAHLVATAAKSVIKQSFDRSRPEKALADGQTHFARGDSHDHELNSFPSGHTAGAVAVARAASRDIEGAAVPGAIGAAAVAAVQAPAGHHYLSDVVVGAAVGWVSEAVVSAVFDRLEPAIEQRLTGK
ncbi:MULTISPECIES: phosphatase PAP2 family protein [unclassified Sphingomonas]|uniref:phosphatase PAP2 family protein n=1 Tax=unclassified Sphingomonas TaxID=196159 RepID=UPI002269F6BB|nr:MULTISPECIES: phosphatase PAP2 family protein [unclassified Sphingomonas]